MATMLFADEVLPPERARRDRRGRPRSRRPSASSRSPTQLIESLAGDFEPDKYRDTYREQVLALIERKAAGKEIAVQPAAEEVAAPAPDLMSALKASLDAVRAREGDATARPKPRRKPRRQESRRRKNPPPKRPRANRPPRNPPPSGRLPTPVGAARTARQAASGAQTQPSAGDARLTPASYRAKRDFAATPEPARASDASSRRRRRARAS